jgi:iron complex outermembrane recepter protein
MNLRSKLRAQGACLTLTLIAAGVANGAGPDALIEEVVVVASSSIQARLGDTGSSSVLLAEEIRNIGATHINETLARVPGVWISRGSGQEHLSAIRSAVYTGAGACGEFSYLENGIPLRPAGFCNINNLFEANTEQAQAIEVWRGPASAVLGGNALHGAINVVTPVPEGLGFSIEGGPYDFYRTQAWGGVERGDHQIGASFVTTSSNGYRDETGYEQQKLHIAHLTEVGGWAMRNSLTATNLNQETGGFVPGFEAYDDGDLRDTNPNPEAYRDAWSLRASSQLTKDAWVLKPYLRRSQMRFLQHFLPGQPLEENEQTSVGLIAERSYEFDSVGFVAGTHIEYMTGALREFQAEPTAGSAFIVATRPSGLHYDYDVDSLMAAAYYNLTKDFTERTRLIHSLRLEHLAYDYDNHHLVGNTRDDGSNCGFGGCLYTRPASRDDSFTNVGVRFGFETDFGDDVVYGAISTGFRPPQATELYRLRGGQVVADLDSEELSSVEVGYKTPFLQVAMFYEQTRNLILRDADAFNISNGKTDTFGFEIEGSIEFGTHTLSVATTFARHRYAFDRLATGRETIEDGNEIDTAPRWLGNIRWRTDVSESLSSEFELSMIGEHYVNAANTAEYDGHHVLHWRGQYQVSDNLVTYVRLVNVLDERYADRADFAFGSYRYFPAMPRQLYLGLRYDLQ